MSTDNSAPRNRARKAWRNGIEPGTPEWDARHNTPQDCERMRAGLISIQVAIAEGANNQDILFIVNKSLYPDQSTGGKP